MQSVSIVAQTLAFAAHAFSSCDSASSGLVNQPIVGSFRGQLANSGQPFIDAARCRSLSLERCNVGVNGCLVECRLAGLLISGDKVGQGSCISPSSVRAGHSIGYHRDNKLQIDGRGECGCHCHIAFPIAHKMA